MRRIKQWGLPFAIAIIAIATLTPSGATNAGTDHFCLLCGDRGLADALLNVLLFAPLGATLRARGRSLDPSLLLAACISTAIEAIQTVVPGRDPTVGDLLFNTLGAGAGWGLFHSRAVWLRPSVRTARVLSAVALGSALLVLWLAATLVRPDLPARAYYGQWTPEFANTEHYGGRVLSAHIGDIKIWSNRIVHSEEVRARLAAGVPLRVTAIAGPAPGGLAPIFNIYDDLQREVLTLAAAGQDVLFRYRSRAVRLRLDQKTFRLRYALRGVASGDTIGLEVRRLENRFCIVAATTRSCSIGFDAAQLWQVLLAVEMPWSPLERMIDWLWLLVLVAPAGFWLTSRRHAAITGIAAVAGLFLVSRMGGLLTPSVAAIAATLTGLGLGWWLRSRQRVDQRAHTAIDPGVTRVEHRR